MSNKKTKTPALRTGKALVGAAPHVVKLIRATPVGRESEKVPEDVEVLQSASSEQYSASMYAHSARDLYSVSNWESVLQWRQMDRREEEIRTDKHKRTGHTVSALGTL
jgi:hypothetical protein